MPVARIVAIPQKQFCIGLLKGKLQESRRTSSKDGRVAVLAFERATFAWERLGPFDRLLTASALHLEMPLIAGDEVFDMLPALVVVVTSAASSSLSFMHLIFARMYTSYRCKWRLMGGCQANSSGANAAKLRMLPSNAVLIP